MNPLKNAERSAKKFQKTRKRLDLLKSAKKLKRKRNANKKDYQTCFKNASIFVMGLVSG